MKKTPSLFCRNYAGDGLVRDEVVVGSEWVLAGEGRATVKYDGTSCLVRDGKLYRRHDRKPNKQAYRAVKKRKERGEDMPAAGWYLPADFRPAPPDWEGCEEAPNLHTGHWPGCHPFGRGPGAYPAGEHDEPSHRCYSTIRAHGI